MIDVTPTQNGYNSPPGTGVKLQETATKLQDQAREALQSKVAQGKDFLSNRLDALANSVQQFSGEQQTALPPVIAGALTDVGQHLGTWAQQLQKTDIDELVSEGRQFVRENRTLVLVGGAVLGFALARFLKSSGQE